MRAESEPVPNPEGHHAALVAFARSPALSRAWRRDFARRNGLDWSGCALHGGTPHPRGSRLVRRSWLARVAVDVAARRADELKANRARIAEMKKAGELLPGQRTDPTFVCRHDGDCAVFGHEPKDCKRIPF